MGLGIEFREPWQTRTIDRRQDRPSPDYDQRGNCADPPRQKRRSSLRQFTPNLPSVEVFLRCGQLQVATVNFVTGKFCGGAEGQQQGAQNPGSDMPHCGVSSEALREIPGASQHGACPRYTLTTRRAFTSFATIKNCARGEGGPDCSAAISHGLSEPFSAERSRRVARHLPPAGPNPGDCSPSTRKCRAAEW